jgi:hypothetical protein
METVTEQPSISNLYCIKSKTYTENVEPREEQITSKGKLRSVVKAVCAVCSKKRNRFTKSVKDTNEVPNVVKPQNKTKKLEKLSQQYL